MPSSPLGSTNCRTTSGVACHHCLWAAHTVERCRAWHAFIAFGLADTVGRHRSWLSIIALGRQTWSNDVRHSMPSSPLGSTHGRTMSDVACHIAFCLHTQSNDVGRGMPSLPFGSTHGPTTSGVACHHRLWAAQTVERRPVWHAIISFGLAHTVGRHRVWLVIIAL